MRMKRRWMWVVAAGVVAMVVVLGRLGPYFGSHHLTFGSHHQTTEPASSGVPYAEGTAGRDEPDVTDAVVSPSTIQEIETITGAIDGHELIGRRVELRLKATGVTSQGAFWVGPQDNHVLVAPARGEQVVRRPVREGEAVTIMGTILEMPNARQRLSWGLTAPDLVQLTDQRIYIRADRIRF
jgi:hypothetical protein